jgi:hypothetical protein
MNKQNRKLRLCLLYLDVLPGCCLVVLRGLVVMKTSGSHEPSIVGDFNVCSAVISVSTTPALTEPGTELECICVSVVEYILLATRESYSLIKTCKEKQYI